MTASGLQHSISGLFKAWGVLGGGVQSLGFELYGQGRWVGLPAANHFGGAALRVLGRDWVLGLGLLAFLFLNLTLCKKIIPAANLEAMTLIFT